MPFLLLAWGFVKGFVPKVPWQVWVFCITLALIAITVFYYHHKWTSEGRERGRTEAIETIRKQNANDLGKAERGEHDVNKCYADGGDWDRVAGRCMR